MLAIDFIKSNRADLKDGLLSIDLVREIPEAMRPRKVSIGGSEGNQASIESAGKQTVEATAQEGVEA